MGRMISLLLVFAVGLCFFSVFWDTKEREIEPTNPRKQTNQSTEITQTTKMVQTTKAITYTENTEKIETNVEDENKIFAVWLTYSEIGKLVKGKDETEYRKSIEELFDELIAGKINTVFYQCRAFCDSFYESEIFPVSKYISASSQPLSFDPFENFIEIGHSRNIKIHCWLNPYRVSYDSEINNLPKTSPARKLYKKNKELLLICDNGIYINPAFADGRGLVLSGIKEILNKYKVDGIHFDDYFYPVSDNLNDKALYKKYKEGGGFLTLENWRRENVSALVSSVYSLVKDYNEKIIFSVSPSADIEMCRNVYYADVEKWCSEEGFVDYIIPQIYFGFENDKMPFERVFKDWSALGEKGVVKMVCGLAPYKCGKPDKFAGTGEKEWTENVNILSRQYEQIRKSQLWQGFSLFSYSYSFGDNMNEISKKEIKKLLYMVE